MLEGRQAAGDLMEEDLLALRGEHDQLGAAVRAKQEANAALQVSLCL